jgi:hypothetical protein
MGRDPGFPRRRGGFLVGVTLDEGLADRKTEPLRRWPLGQGRVGPLPAWVWAVFTGLGSRLPESNR